MQTAVSSRINENQGDRATPSCTQVVDASSGVFRPIPQRWTLLQSSQCLSYCRHWLGALCLSPTRTIAVKMVKGTGTKSIPERLRELGFESYGDYPSIRHQP